MRKVVQIATSAAVDSSTDSGEYFEALFALCDDGTIWRLDNPYRQHPNKPPEWVQMPTIPS